LLFVALGTGLLVSSTVAVAAYFVHRFWNVEAEARNYLMLWWIEDIAKRVITMSTNDASHSTLLADLDIFLIKQRAKERADTEMRQEAVSEIIRRREEILEKKLRPKTSDPEREDPQEDPPVEWP
jgi:hypothetical protein